MVALGCLLGGLGRLLGALGRLWGASGAPLGRLWAALGCILALMDASGLDLGRFWGRPDWIWGGSGGSFQHALGVQALDLHDAFIAAENSYSY